MVNTGRSIPEINRTMIGDTIYSITRSIKGNSLLVLKNYDPISEVKKTNKYLENTARTIGVTVEVLEQAIAKAKFVGADEETEVKENPGAIAVRLIRTNMVELFNDQLKTTYVIIEKTVKKDTKDAKDTNLPVPNSSQNNIINLDNSIRLNTSVFTVFSVFSLVRAKSEQFKQWVAGLYFKDQGKTISESGIKAALMVISKEASSKPFRTLYNRIAPDGNGGIWWDMTDDLERAIHITKEGWKVVDNPPKIFRRYSHQMPLTEPAEKGSLLPLLDYILLEGSGEMLLSVLTPISYLIPDVPHVIEILGGTKGSTKSGNHRFRKRVVDPSATPLLTMPKDHDEMVQQADHHYLMCYDNVSKIEEYQSDLICKIITGAGFSKRMLFSDDDDVIRQLMRCICINGIVFPADKADMLDRAVLQTALMLDDKNRKTVAEINKNMDKDAPKVIRAMLDVLVIALNKYDTVKPKRNNRMADFTRWGCALTEALGFDKGHFENAYHRNINTQDEEAVKASPVATWLIHFMEFNNHIQFTGSANELLQEILDFANNILDRDLTRTVDDWPRGATPFGRKLKEIIPSLNGVGYKITYVKGTTRRYVITKISDESGRTGQQLLVKIPNLSKEDFIKILYDFESRYGEQAELKIMEIPKSIKAQFKELLRNMKELDKSVTVTQMFDAWGTEISVTLEELEKLILVLGRDGAIYQPRPGYWRVSDE